MVGRQLTPPYPALFATEHDVAVSTRFLIPKRHLILRAPRSKK